MAPPKERVCEAAQEVGVAVAPIANHRMCEKDDSQR
jgi:hypothetical protein